MESSYYESLGVFFNGMDADAYIAALEKDKLPVKVDLIAREDDPDEIIGVEIFIKKSATEPALKIKRQIIDATIDNSEFYLHNIPDEELLQIPYHPEDANDFDYWAALELIKRKGLPLENRDWEKFRREKIIEILEKSAPKSSGLFPLGLSIIGAGIILLALTYKQIPYLSLLFFTGTLFIGKHMSKSGGFDEKERKKGKVLLWLSIVLLLANLYFSYLAVTND